MTPKEAKEWVDIARMNYICDPQECGFEKDKDPCTAFHCDEMHDAQVEAIKALDKQIPKKPNDRTETMLQCGIIEVDGECDCGCRVYMRDRYCPRCGQAIDWGYV